MAGVPSQVAETTSLAPYIPSVAVDWEQLAPGRNWRSIDGTLVFVDVSGFTSLSERLSAKGRIGAEELTLVLDRVFGEMIEMAVERGGSLLKFGGDALLLLFTGADHPIQACAATLEMRSVLRDAARYPSSVGRIRLDMSSGIHTGSFDFFLVGDAHRELIIAGPAATHTTALESAAKGGEVLVSDDTSGRLPEGFTTPGAFGHVLRKRVINHPRCGPVTPSASGSNGHSRLVPVALRRHLIAQVGGSEHRVGSIGFIRFTGVDAILASRSRDHVADALNVLVRSIQEAVGQEGVTFLGSDIDANGGKIILVSGVPDSQHDDEGRMLRALRRIVDTDGAFDLSVGVNRGHVFSGDVGTSSRRTYTVMGDAVNLTARLMANAPAGGIFATAAVLDKASTLFRTEMLAPFHVKGKAEPVQAYSVHEEIGVRPPELEHLLPFHGRTTELSQVVGIVNSCSWSGGGGMTTISGQTGVGKSRLIAEALKRCPGMDPLIVQAEPYAADNPYWAFRDPMRRLLGIERSTQKRMVKQLEKVIARSAPDLSDVTPLLGDVLQIEVPENEATAAIDPKFRPERTASAMIELLTSTCPRPVALVAEDGQWLDEASLNLVRTLGESAESKPWTVIMTVRTDEEDHEVLGTEVALGPLSDDSIREIALEATAAAPLRPHEMDAIVARVDGNPLFLSETLRLVRDTGTADGLPESLGAVVSTQIDTLPPLARQLLRYSSVLGRSFRRVVFDELLAAEGLTLDEATEEELAQFLQSDGEGRLSFRHTVVHDAAYESLPYRTRRELHSRAAELIESAAGQDTDPVAEILATHYSLAGDHHKTWRYSRIAAARARKSYANSEAGAQYKRALDAARHLDDLLPHEVAGIWTSLGEVRDSAGQYEAAREAYSHAMRSTRDPALRADLYRRRSETWYGSGDLTQALRNVSLGKTQVEVADEEPRDRTLARLEAYESSLRMARGEFVKARECAQFAADLAVSVGEEEALARAYYVLDGANFMLGNDEPRRGPEAIEIYERLGLTERSVGVMNNLGAFSYLEGRWDEAVSWYEKSLDAADRSGNIFEGALTRANIAEVLIGQRHFDAAIPLLDDAERTFVSSQASLYMPLVGLLRARADLGRGEVENAVGALDGLLERQVVGDQTPWTGETAVALADALIAADRAEDVLSMIARLERDAPEIAETPDLTRVQAHAMDLLGNHEAALDGLQSGLESPGSLYGEALILETLVDSARRAGETPDQVDLDRLTELFDLLGVSAG